MQNGYLVSQDAQYRLDKSIFACVAQLVEQRIRNAQVAGSSPAASSTKPVISKEITGFVYFLGHYNFSNLRVGVYLVFTLVFITADNRA